MRQATLFFSLAILSASAFSPSFLTALSHQSSALFAKKKAEKKGFGAPVQVKRESSAGQKKRDAERSKYDELAASGGQEYSVFVRQFGSDDDSWLPTGAIAVPRGTQVPNAINANLDGLKSAIVRMYPKLVGFEDEFEFGFNLKMFPDEPVEVANLGDRKPQGMSVGNWISNLLSPIDASEVAGSESKE